MWDVFILRNSSRKLKTVADNAILQDIAVSSGNISESIKIKTENDFLLKRNVCKFRRNKNRSGKQLHRRSRYLCVASRNLKNRNEQFHGRDNIVLHHLVVLSSYLSFVKKSFFLNQYAGEADHIWE